MPHAGREEEELEAAAGPVDRDQAADTRLEEERRLMYVAITRAKRSLTLSWCRSRRRAKATIDCQPSRFIGEMQLDASADGRTPVASDDARRRLAALRELFIKK